MRYQTAGAGETWSTWFFLPRSQTVTVTARKQDGTSVSLSSSSTVEDEPGTYRFNSSQITTQPTTLTHILLVATDGLGNRDAVTLTIGGYPDSINATVSSRATQTSVDAISQSIIAATLSAASGSTSTEVRTGATQVDDFYNDMILVVVNASGVAARRITDFANTNGAFTVSPALPFTPAAGNTVLVIARTATAAGSADPAVIADAVWDEAIAGHIGAGSTGEKLNSRAAEATVPANVQTGMTAQGYTTGRAPLLDNLDASISSRASQTSVDGIRNRLSVAALTVSAGATSTSVPTGATQADDFYNDHQLLVINAAGSASRRISDYSQASGTFTVTPAFPFTPASGDQAFVIGRVTIDIPAAVQSGLTSQGYTTTRATKLDNLDVPVSSRTDEATIIADVQSGLNANGYTSSRATKLDNLDVAVSTRQAAATFSADVQAAMSAQGYTVVRAGFLDGIVAATLSAAAGSTSTEIRTGATQADDFYNGLVIMVFNAAGAAAREITDYAQTNGAFTISPALPFTPSPGDKVLVIGRVGGRSSLESLGYTSARASKLDNLDVPVSSRADEATLVADIQAGLSAQGYSPTRASNLDNLDATISSRTDEATIVADVQSGLSAQGYSPTRATKLDNLDVPVSSRTDEATIVSDVQAGLSAQGYSPTRATKLDNLDATISSRTDEATIVADVQSGLTAQGLTTGRAVLLDNLAPLLVAVEKIRKVTTNKVVVNASDSQVDVFEDNGTTIAFSFTISSDRRTRTPV